MNIGWQEILLLLLVCLLLFGAGRLPEIARQIGKALHELKKSLKAGGDGDKPQK